MNIDRTKIREVSDVEAFMTECYEYESNMYAFARKLCGSTTVDPKDLVAQAMGKAFRFFHKINDRGEGLKQWLLKTVKNEFLLAIRDFNTLKRGRGYVFLSYGGNVDIESTYPEETSSRRCEREIQEACSAYIEGTMSEEEFIVVFDEMMPIILPEVMEIRVKELKGINKIFFALSFFMGFTPTEIAEIRGIEMRGAQSRINRLRKKIRARCEFDELMAELGDVRLTTCVPLV